MLSQKESDAHFWTVIKSPGNHGGEEGVIRPSSYMLLSHAKWDHIMQISLSTCNFCEKCFTNNLITYCPKSIYIHVWNNPCNYSGLVIASSDGYPGNHFHLNPEMGGKLPFWRNEQISFHENFIRKHKISQKESDNTFGQLYSHPGDYGGAEGVLRPSSYMLLSETT